MGLHYCVLTTILLVCSAYGCTYDSPYITYEAGSTNLIFSVPHGGDAQPGSIPDRTVCPDTPYRGCHLADGSCSYFHLPRYTPEYCGCNRQPKDTSCKVAYLRDSFTKEIAIGVRNELYNMTGEKTHIIINDLKRNKMDGNRNKAEAAFGVLQAEDAWETYHHRIQQAIRSTVSKQTLFIDFHGQTHDEGWIELGYTLNKYQLNSRSPELVFNHNNTTIGQLVLKHCGVSPDWGCFENILRGDRSLGYYIQREEDEDKQRYSVVPSPQTPSPGQGSYYTGGYNVKTYAGYDGRVDAIQIEMPRKLRWETASRGHFINALAKAIKGFMDRNYCDWRA